MDRQEEVLANTQGSRMALEANQIRDLMAALRDEWLRAPDRYQNNERSLITLSSLVYL
jgi:hypothetical protein